MTVTARRILASFPSITVESLWALASLTLPLWLASGLPLLQLDFWWHLKIGQIIVQTHHIPQTDLFSFTAQGRPFVHQNWLAEVILYGLYRVGGPPLVVFSNAVLIAGAFAVVFYLARKASGSSRVAAACTLAAEAASWRFIGARPQVFSFVLFALTYALVQDVRRGASTRRPWVLPLIMAFWVNLHGAFVMGFALLAVVWVGEAISRDRTTLIRLTVVGALSLLALGLNPMGYRVFAYVVTVAGDPVSQKLVLEWQPPELTDPADTPFFAFLGFCVVSLIWARQRPRFTDVALFGTFVALALISLRNVIWFALVTAPILATYLPEWPFPGLADRLGLARLRQPTAPPGRHKWIHYLMVATLIGLTVLLSPWVRPALEKPGTDHALIDPRIPVEAIAYIEEHDLRGRIFHPQRFGDYMIWRLYPRQRIFLDGRVHLYGEALWNDYQAIIEARFDWQRLLDKYDVEILLLDRQSGENDELLRAVAESDRWVLIYTDEIAAIYVRREPGE